MFELQRDSLKSSRETLNLRDVYATFVWNA